MINYQLGKIYRIVDNVTGKEYIGSTCDITLARRLSGHRGAFKRFQNGKGNFMTSFIILENNNFEIFLIENFPCNSKDELHARERHFIEQNDCVNKNLPNRKRNEYYIDNKDVILEKAKEYREDNKQNISEYQKAYQIENKQNISEYQKQYRTDNKDVILEQKKEYYNDNKDVILEKSKEYYTANKQNIKEYNKQYQTENKQKIKQYYKQYYQNNKALKQSEKA